MINKAVLKYVAHTQEKVDFRHFSLMVTDFHVIMFIIQIS
jgi:hypothetical protein